MGATLSATNPVALVQDLSTVAPACKVYVLSKEIWPYKRADLTTGL